MSPDTVPGVIHDAAQRPCGRRRSSIVDNSAERLMANVHKLSLARPSAVDDGSVARPKKHRPAVHAAMQSRFDVPKPTRLTLRSLGCVEAPVQKSKRTSTPTQRVKSPQRGLRIRS